MMIPLHKLPLPAAAAVLLAACDSGPADPAASAESAPPARHIPLEGEPNFRDLGGYVTADGRSVRRGTVYRSGKLSKLSDADVARLEELGVRTVVNFLAPNEIEHDGADRVPEGVEQISIPIDPRTGLGDILGDLIHARKTGDFARIPAEVNPDIHRVLVGEAREQYAGLLRLIADPDKRPIVFHCSHGVHRTGTGAAILLSALGVPWDEVRKDYLLSNECRREEVDRRIGELRDLEAENKGLAPGEVDTTNIEAFYVLEGGYIDASLETIREDYGSVDGYLDDGLGLSEDEIESLRSSLLE